jgi:hypothetical protein
MCKYHENNAEATPIAAKHAEKSAICVGHTSSLNTPISFRLNWKFQRKVQQKYGRCERADVAGRTAKKKRDTRTSAKPDRCGEC